MFCKKGLNLYLRTHFRCFQTNPDDTFSCFRYDENGGKFSKRAENSVGKKGEIACDDLFLLLPHCFLKTCTAKFKIQGLFMKGLKFTCKRYELPVTQVCHLVCSLPWLT